MKPDIPGSWVRLDIVRAAEGLRVDAHAGPDLAVELPEIAAVPPAIEDAKLDLFGQPVTLPGATIATIAQCAQLVESRPAAVLPVFVAPRRGIRQYPWEQALDGVLTELAAATNFELIRLARPQGQPAPDADLPIRVLAAGPLAGAAIQELERSSWLQDPVIQRNGLALSATKDSRLERELRDLRPAVVVADARFLPAILRWGVGRPRGPYHDLRLVIAIEDGVPRTSIDRTPDGTSIITVARSRASDAIADLVLGLVHDQPLHTVVKGVRARGHAVELRGSPASVHALRLEPMARRLIDEQQVAREALARVHELGAARIDRLVGQDLRLDFGREIGGFAQVAATRARLSTIARARPGSLSPRVEMGIGGRGFSLDLPRSRTVDLQIESMEPRGQVAPWISPRSTLRAGTRYQLCFVIGIPLPGSLLEVAPPAIDAALPPLVDDEGRELEIAVYDLGLEVLGAAVQKLRLPAAGPSRHLRFELRARARGLARARVIVYYNNQAIQSFLVTATVSSAEQDGDRGTLTAKLEFSRSPEFTNLAVMQPRLACIAVNHTEGEPWTHKFMVKGKGTDASDVNIPQTTLSVQMKQLRDVLHAATFKGDDPRFAMDGDASHVQRTEFRTVIQQLADQGQKLYRMVALRAREHDKLKAIRDSSGGTIQVVRFDLGYSFPWAILYDFALPVRAVGDPPPTICVDPACKHSNTVPGYCIRGFWGVRHVVEELLAQGERNEASTVVPPGAARGVALSLGLKNDFGLEKEVNGFAGASLVCHAQGARGILDLLWDDAKRPAQLIVYSHLETRNLAGARPGRRFVFAADKSTLYADDIFQRWEQAFEEWSAPQTVVFLMGCDSAAVDESLLGGFVEVLHRAGATAIVGTESPAFAALASDFAQKVGRSWWSGKVTLGEAVRRYRIDLLGRGNPLGFVFTALGKSDLWLSRGGAA